jgi:Protein of unknown function (DUF3263)
VEAAHALSEPYPSRSDGATATGTGTDGERAAEGDRQSSPGGEPAPPATVRSRGDQPALSERDLRVLRFERHWWRYPGAKEEAIRAEFGLSATRYYQLLNALIDSPDALVADPMLVRRLRRLRARRRQARAAARGGTPPSHEQR